MMLKYTSRDYCLRQSIPKGNHINKKKSVCEPQSSQEEGRVVLSLELEERGEGEERE